MGENEELGWFPRYIGGQPICNDVGCTTQVWNGSYMPSAKDNAKVEVQTDVTFSPPPIKSCGNRFYVVDELTKLPKDMFRTNISTDDADFKRLSEETAQQIHKAFENLRMTMGNGFPMTFLTRKARKYYKPKFTL